MPVGITQSADQFMLEIYFQFQVPPKQKYHKFLKNVMCIVQNLKLETSDDLCFCELLVQVHWPNRGEQI